MPRGIITFRSKKVTNAFRDRARLRKWLCAVAKDHGLAIDEICFVLLTDRALLGYNQRYLRHDTYTDIITFDLQTGNGVAGDVLISYDRVRENAATFGVSMQHELQRVMVHGLLHLLGHTDKSAKGRASMRAMEDRWLALLSSH